MAPRGKKEALFKPFLFADQDVDALVADITPQGGPLADAADHLRAGAPAEAEVVLRSAMMARPDEVGAWHRLLLASAQDRKGDRAGAVRTLRKLAETAGESRIRLWAWSALRNRGEAPDAARAAKAEGIVVEVEVGKGIDTLAAYADRSARYLLHTGARVIWDAPDARLDKAVAAVLVAADSVVARMPDGRLPGEPGAGMARMTLLTQGGLRAVEEPLATIWNEGQPYAALFAEVTTLLEQIVAIANWGPKP